MLIVMNPWLKRSGLHLGASRCNRHHDRCPGDIERGVPISVIGISALLTNKGSVTLAVALDCFTTERLTGTLRCQVHDAEVNTEGIRCVLRGRWKHFKGHSQIEDAFAVDQISLPFDRTHTSLLVLPEQERHQYAPSKRQEGDGITA